MQLDFWNNPLVVSAFRVKYRRGGLSSSVMLYLLVLAAGGAAMQYYNALLGGDWQRKYFIALIGLQFIVSVFMASITTAASLRSEVVNRTLDFQRIATLSPQQILLGKLLGEPALAYLLAVASFPLALWCWLMGGVTIEVLLFMYLTLATTTLMAGSFGLVTRLEPPAGKAANTQGGGEGAVFGILCGLGMPGPLFYGLVQNCFWDVTVPLFGYQVPLVFLIPPVQLGLMVLPFQIMVRLLVNPLNPMLSKRSGYLTLAVVDLIAAAVLVSMGTWGGMLSNTFGARSAAFCLVHLMASALLMTLITPRGEIVDTWLWRFRRRSPWLWNWWIGERSPNAGAMAMFALMAVVGWLLLFRLPASWLESPSSLAAGQPVALAALAATVILTLSVGLIYQLTMFLQGRRRAVLSNLISLLVFVPYLLGKAKDYYPVEPIIALSPIDQFKGWLNPGVGLDVLSPIPLLVVYGWLFVGAAWGLALRLRAKRKEVDQKLQQMGVVKTPA